MLHLGQRRTQSVGVLEVAVEPGSPPLLQCVLVCHFTVSLSSVLSPRMEARPTGSGGEPSSP